MLEFSREDLTAADVERLRRIYEPLTQSVRELIDAAIRTEVDATTVAEVTAQIEVATARLRSNQMPGPFGVRFTFDAGGMAWGNPVIGVRNPIAPPVVLDCDDSGKVSADFHLGAAYEGPPGHVHGGVCALILDHVLGEAASGGLTRPAFTGTITCRYLRATRLGALHTEATIERVEGVKTFAVGHLADEEGVTVEAEGVFVVPKWAR
ncbi:MAG: PaaI family thioesterase [Mycobacteriaceae bacterium]|nr:PaaI family thioesterase [Mycobacteriaceae bacterium]